MKYYAVTSKDGSGPAWGIGTTPEEALSDARKWVGGDLDDVKICEITQDSYQRIAAGNPDDVQFTWQTQE